MKTRGWVRLVTLAGLTGLITIFALGAAERGAADTVSNCAGKPLCVDLTVSQVQASYSITAPADDHYLTVDSFRVYNNGSTSNLVNITVNVSWADDPSTVPTTSDYRAAYSDPQCSVSGAQTLTCVAPKSLGPGGFVTYGPLVFRSASDTSGASDTNITVNVSAKEQTNSNKQGPPKNTAFTSVSHATSYEGNSDLDISTAGGGISTVTLATANVGTQHSALNVPAGGPRELYTLSEQNFGANVSCPTGLTCIGQQVTTVATGLHPVNLQTTYTGALPSGLNENNLVVVHTPDGGQPVTIGTACSGTTLFSGIQPSNIPCRLVSITHLPSGNVIVQVDTWDTSNGQWKIG